MEFPENLKYTKDHEWVKIDGSDAVMGITAFAVHELGEIVFADLPAVGKTFKKGDSICVVESTKAASDVYSALSGTVKEINQTLANSPDRINNSPYVEGWLVKLSGLSKAEESQLMSAAEYKALVGDKI